MENIKGILSILLTTFTYLLGGIDLALKSLLIVIVIDYITGILSAIYENKLNSAIGLKGLLKKVGYLCVVALSVIIDNLTGQDGIIRNLVIYYFVANEGISILENLGKLNVKLPKKLVESLEQLKSEGE